MPIFHKIGNDGRDTDIEGAQRTITEPRDATVPRVEYDAEEGAGTPMTHTWCGANAERFLVRHGPNYSSNKRKASSAPSLYDMHALQLYSADRKVDGMATHVDLPQPEFHHPSVPSLLVVNIQLPTEPQKVLKGSTLDGPTLHAVFCFTLKEETARALGDLDAAGPAVRLLADYFRVAESEPEMRKRFKALAFVNNLDQIAMHRLLSPVNGKPILITESGSLLRGSRRTSKAGSGQGEFVPPVRGETKGDGGNSGGSSFATEEFLEFDIHVRKWNYMARKGLNKLIHKVNTLNVSIAFLVEGRDDSELPERVLGCLTINAIEIERARRLNLD